MITAKGKIFLITSTSASLGRLIRHKGILFKYDHDLYVVHRTIKGLEIITYKEFLSTRQLYNNCETFANKFVDEYSTKHRHHYSEQVLYWVYAVLLLVFLLTLALLTGIGVTTTISALTVILIFLTVISSNWDYVK